MNKRIHKLLIKLYNFFEYLNFPKKKYGKFIIPWHYYTQREKTFLNVFNNHNDDITSFLNIGFHNWEDPRNHWWVKFCNQNNIKWNILEIFKKNITDAIKIGCPENNIIEGDLLKTQTYKNYDCILFWHGPEHVDKEIFLNKLPEIEKKANKLIIFGMPLGEEIQGQIYGNKWEEHISSWEKYEWEKLGYKTFIVHDRDPGHITAYKIIK